MPEWADVYVHSADDRAALRDKALFFIPNAYETLADEEGLSTAAVVAHSSANKVRFNGKHAGRAVVTKVMKCQPIALASALGFIDLANDILQSRDSKTRFSSRDIVACVFRLRDFGSVLNYVKFTPEKVADKTSIKLPIIKSALKGGRLQYVHARAIYEACVAAAQQNKQELDRAETSKANGFLNLGEETDFITTAVKRDFNAAVLKDVNRDGEERYVYEREDLVPAPPSDHPWALT